MPLFSFAQVTQNEIRFSFTFEGEPIDLSTTYITDEGDTLTFSKIKLYVSSVRFDLPDSNKSQPAYGPWLLDAENENQFALNDIRQATSFSMCIGLDSLTNTSGALGGDLDPMHGMYWTWQSGYIHLKIEGSCSSLQTRNKAFAFHLGGYQHPHRAFEHRTFPVSNEGEVSLQFPLDSFLESIDLQETNAILSPSITASELLSVFTSQILLAE